MFNGVSFKWQFRSYQQQVLDRADRYLQDGRIHIVAPPGSGKTVLGLELICRLGCRALILSPTTTIRNQWCRRYVEDFSGSADGVSCDIRRLSLITSATYQALCAAMQRSQDAEDGADYSSFDIIRTVKELGIGTICLDEAHHLQNEWQRALEQFLREAEGVKIIALTATPPYDASPAEWERYISLCGEIDEEIFVPELVKQGSLCPHQDYVYFNFPTEEETRAFDDYRRRVAQALEKFYASGYIATGYGRLMERRYDYDFLYEDVGGAMAFVVLCDAAGIKVDGRLCRCLALRRPFSATRERLEKGIDFLIGALLDEEEGAACLAIFREYGVTERGKVALDLSEKLRRRLLSSVGKLKGIAEIIARENENMGGRLRMLILTDYIKKESVSLIGSDRECDSVSLVSVYETARRTGVSCGAVSGSLVILPKSCSAALSEYGVKFRMSGTADSSVCIYDFQGSNIQKVAYVSRLFEEGKINLLVGTKSLLGEGWDAPFVNTLILASFVGSFMLSNQMRGRAIRVYGGDGEKTADIWHLVTVERPHLEAKTAVKRHMRRLEEDKEDIKSYDLETVSRRFDCFVAPDYETGEIKSGISRVTPIRPPYDEGGIERINGEMFARAACREQLSKIWHDAVDGSSGRLNEVSDIPKQNAARYRFVFVNAVTLLFVLTLMQVMLSTAIRALSGIFNSLEDPTFWQVAYAVLLFAVCTFLFYIAINLLFIKLLSWLSPKKAVEKLSLGLIKTMQEFSFISPDARVAVEKNSGGVAVSVELLNASVHDQSLFHAALRDMFSPIRNPRYILIPERFGVFSYYRAMACPEILATRGEYAEGLAHNLRRTTGRLIAVYTRTERGRRFLLKCRKSAFVTKNYNLIHGTKRLSRWE